MLWAGGGRGGDLYCMGNGLLIFARANDGADRLFHGALLSTVNYLLIVISVEERSVMEQLPTSDSGGTVTAIIDTPRDGAPGADLEAGLLGWLFGCRRCAAVDELRAGCEQRYATKRCLQLHYLVNASSTGPRSGTLRCGATSERGPAWSSKNQAV